MSLEISLSDSGKYLRVLVTRPLDREFAQQLARDVMAVFRAAEPRPNGILLDVRTAPSISRPSETHTFAYQDAQRLNVDRDARLAFLVADGDRSHDFAETALRNAGYVVLSFTEEAGAIRWLESEAYSRPKPVDNGDSVDLRAPRYE